MKFLPLRSGSSSAFCSALVASALVTASVQGEILLSEDFESPNVSATSLLQDGGTYKKGALPDNGNWIGSTQGFGADRKGLIDKNFGDFTAPPGNNQGFYFGYTNSGITSSTAAITHTLTDATYTLSFDVARDNNQTQSSYTMELVAFSTAQHDGLRNDVRPATKPGVVLATVSGNVATNDISPHVSLVFQPDPSLHLGDFGKRLGIRFIGNSSHPVLDNVLLVVEGGSQGNLGDTDGDGLSDAWEITNFGNLSHDGNADSDGDGLTDAFEHSVELDPNDYDTVAGIPDWVGYSESVNSEILFTENFESPNVSSTSVLQDGGTFKKGALPDNGKWIGATQGFGADRKGLINKSFGDFAAPSGNNQGLYFGYTNSGITSAVASIPHTLKTGMIYVLSFNVARDNNLTQSSYTMEMVAFTPAQGDAVRNDVRSGLRPGVVLASADGIVTTNDMSTRVSIIFKPDASTHAAQIGKSLGIRFIGNSTHPILDDVTLTAIDPTILEPGTPGYLTVEQWDGVPGQTLADLFAGQAFYENANWIYLTPQAKSKVNVGDAYGLRMTGTVIPPQTGDIQFRLSSGGQCKLFLSTDEKAFNRREIVAAEIPLGEADWMDGSQSQPVHLEAGKEYFVEVLMKEDVGDDHVTVAWQYYRRPPAPWHPQLVPIPFEIIPGESLKSYMPDAGDLDGDGMLDSWEALVGLNPNDNGRINRNQAGYADIDGDGLLNYEEYQHNTKPNDPDSDGDGMPDVWEVNNGLKPDEASDADFDADFDGLSNLAEFQASTDPNSIYSGGSAVWPQDAIIAWYRTDGDYITVDGSSQVSEWRNSVGNGHLMTQSNASNQPELIRNNFNGHDSLRFTATDTMAIASDGLDILTPESNGFSVLGAFRTGARSNEPVSPMLSNDIDSASGFRMGVYEDQLHWWSNESGGTLGKGSPLDTLLPQWVAENSTCQFGLHHHGSDPQDLTEIYVNGKLQSSFSGALIKGNMNPIKLQSILGTAIPPGDWGELIIANRTLNIGEATLVQDYLRGKLQGMGPLAEDEDGDGEPDWKNYPPSSNSDSDGDGMPDEWELLYGLDPNDANDAQGDLDTDGLTNFEEFYFGTNPANPDTDGDGMSDWWEVIYALDPNNPSDALLDPDQDGLSNLEEISYLGTHPFNNDTDIDGMPDGWEVLQSLNPCDSSDANEDLDGDGLTNLQEYELGTDIYNSDSDGDLMPDGWETENELNPNDSADASLDLDNDGLSNLEEYQHGTDPHDNDSDGDGMPDGWEVIQSLNPAEPADANEDLDGDGLTNRQEYGLGTDLRNQDSDGDGIPDSVDTEPLTNAQTFADADADGIPDADDGAPGTPRGPAPSVASEAASGNPICDLIQDETVHFILSVSNPGGSMPDASNLTFFLNGVQKSATITAIGSSGTFTQRFLLTWTAKTTTGYPTRTLQNLVLRFCDAQKATSWLNLARIDVAEWEGMVAGSQAGAESDYWHATIHSHSQGIYETPSNLAYSNIGNSTWYRGPRIVPIHRFGVSTADVSFQITAGMRYPFVFLARTGSAPLSIHSLTDIADASTYPHDGIWYHNNYTKAIRVERPPGQLDIPVGETLFHLMPERTQTTSVINVLISWENAPGEWQPFNNTNWAIHTAERFRMMASMNFLGYSTSTFLHTEATIVPHAAGTLEVPGLPLPSAYHTRPLLPDSYYPGSEPRAVLPISRDACHKVVLRVGPDAAAISNGIGLWLRKGTDRANSPQSGFTLTVQNSGGNTNLAIPADGKITFAAGSENWQRLTSPQGLSLFMTRDATVTNAHDLSLHLLKKQEWYTAESTRIASMNLFPVDVAVDANHDGEITFDGRDRTSLERPFRFWVNDDQDRYDQVDEDDWEADDFYVNPDANSDTDVDELGVHASRDLEDLTRIWLNLSGISHMLSASDPSVKLKVRMDFPAIERARIILYRAFEPDGGRQYLEDEGTGYSQLQEDYGMELCRVGTLTQEVPRRAWENMAEDNVVHLLFEGLKKGDGHLIFELWKDGKKVFDMPPIDLRLQKAADMYETWSVGDVSNTGVDYSIWPEVSATQTSGQGLPAPEKPEEKDYVMFVHGWNMEAWEKEAYANTMFKRMWHQGYQGRFGAYRWPTFHSFPEYFDPAHFNASEVRAWNSASPLKALIENRAAVFGPNKIRLYAHSMGNIVCGEALRQFGPNGAPVHSYIAAQAAISSHVYDNTTPVRKPAYQMEMPNVYGYYWQQGASDWPPQWEIDGRPSYMDPQYLQNNVAYINHYNFNDYALNGARWPLNQDLKPALNYHYTFRGYVGGYSDYRFIRGPRYDQTVLNFAADRYEIFANAADSAANALGKVGSTGGKFSKSVDVAPLLVYDARPEAHKYHSGQFRSTIQRRWTYWELALDDMHTATPAQ